MEPASVTPGFPKAPVDGIHREFPNTWFSESTAYRNCEVGGFRPAAEQTEFCTPLMPITGKTVGVAATATKLGVHRGLSEKRETSRELRSRAAATADRVHIDSAELCPRLPQTETCLPRPSPLRRDADQAPRVPTVLVVPLEFILNARIPLVLFDVLVSARAEVRLMIA